MLVESEQGTTNNALSSEQWGCMCWSPNWNGPLTDSGTPRFGIRFGDCFFCVFFFSQAQDQPFLTKQTTTQHKLQLSPFLMRGMCRGAPRSSRRVLTPRRVGAHPARVGALLRLDAPRRGGNRGGVGSDAVAGGAGADWATCLRSSAAADVARDGAVLTAASSTRVGGGVSSFRAAN
jgi:hypothetical protein